MRTIPKELTINGQYFDAGALHELAISLTTPGKTGQEQALGQFLQQWLNENDTVVVKTSGSTGIPKLTGLRKEAMLASASMTGRFFNLRENQTALLCMKAEYIAGMMMVVRAMAHRMNLIIAPPDGSPLDHLSANQPIDFAAMVPAQVYNSLKTTESRRKLESIETLIIGGAPVSPDIEKMVKDLDGKIYATFGMTETITHIALRRLNGPERSDVYTVLPGITIETDSRGCLVAEIPYLSMTRVVTNDLVSIASLATFRWLGRADNVINCGGIKLIPEKIETRIASLISQRFFIASQPDRKLGEIPVLVIEDTARFTEKERENLLILIQPQLEKSEMPRSVFLTDRFTETESGKIKRSESYKNAQKV